MGKMKKYFGCPTLLIIPFWLFFSGCATYSQNAAFVSHQVTEGIQRIQEENEKVIVALAETQRAIFDEKWDDIYATVEKKYMDNNKMTSDSPLKFEDRKKIAATAAQIREDILNIIAQKEGDLLNKSRSNTKTVIGINDEVTRYLNSLEDIGKVRSRIKDHFKNIIGINTDGLRDAVKQKLEFKEGSESKK